ncbi:MAG: hypothetical protein K6E51_10785 [Treponema sp.]|nr:hypothetical protein [Treponema sp.]
MAQSKYEFGMELLAAMSATVIAKKQKISKIRAFDKFMKSETARMLFDQDSGMWLNGPDYIADEYRREMYFKRTGKSLGY